MLFGASAANKEQILDHEKDLGRKLEGVRVFKKWDSTLFPSDMQWARDGGRTLFLSIRSERGNGSAVMYKDLANAKPGSALHDDLLRQAQQIKAFKAPVYITYNAEPEAIEAQHMGNGPEFTAAWRNMVDTYRAAGVTNARYVWTMTGYGFTRTDQYKASNYWPGEDYVNEIGADVYNYADCRQKSGQWRSLEVQVENLRSFGLKYPDKGIVLMEWSTVEDPNQPGRKAQWFKDATSLFLKPGYEQFTGLLQWSGRNHVGMKDYVCNFDYASSAASAKAMQAMGAAAGYQATDLQTPVLESTAVTSGQEIVHRGSAASPNGNARSFAVQVPADVKAGDAMVMFLTVNSTNASLGAPSGTGWTRLPAVDGQTVRSVAWHKVATASDAGTVVTVPLSKYAMGQLVLHIYGGTDTLNPVSSFAARVETTAGTAHATPSVAVDRHDSWLVSYWAEKSASNSAWTPPSGQQIRDQSIGAGEGRISTLSVDAGEPVAAGTAGAVTAISGSIVKAVTWSVVLAPAGG